MNTVKYIGLIVGWTALLISACTTPQSLPPQQQPIRVVPGPPTPVPVYCVEDTSQRPAFVDTNEALAAIPDPEAGTKLYRAAIVQYRFWVGVLEAQFKACAKPPG